MDLFLATCQGIGLSLAAGTIAGAFAGGAAQHRSHGGGPVVAILLIAALVGGALLFGASLATEDHPAWPGWPIGALIALGAFGVIRGLVAGAAARAEAGSRAQQGEGSAAAIAGFMTIAALVVAGLSLLISPIALVALVGVLYLGAARRRRDQQKYEGLRVLR